LEEIELRRVVPKTNKITLYGPRNRSDLSINCIYDVLTSQRYDAIKAKRKELLMVTMSKRATIYFDPSIHHILRLKAAETERSISDIVNDALRAELAQDQEDLEAFETRAKEPTVSYENLLKKLKADGKI
jgi:hypothetical protein